MAPKTRCGLEFFAADATGLVVVIRAEGLVLGKIFV
jgi:hypothetical protein